jgi:hypothetical protein
MNLDFSQVQLDQIITHRAGNKAREEASVLSTEPTDIDENTLPVLTAHFVQSVNVHEWFSFDTSTENSVYDIVRGLFSRPDAFSELSKDLARILEERSTHPKIKAGEFNAVLFSNIIFDNEPVQGIGLFKSETSLPFVKMIPGRMKYRITHDTGFEIKGADKGCIILNTDPDSGFKVLTGDRTNKSDEARYWKDDFLGLIPVRNEFHQTKQVIHATSEFLKDRLPEEFEMNKADQIDLMNRSLKYFKKNEAFVQRDFEESVLQDPAVIKSFRNFEQGFRAENNLESLDEFSISKEALRKQTRFLRSVLKLDKNFHIYIHGSRELIQQGVESNGRKYYKIYFDKES